MNAWVGRSSKQDRNEHTGSVQRNDMVALCHMNTNLRSIERKGYTYHSNAGHAFADGLDL